MGSAKYIIKERRKQVAHLYFVVGMTLQEIADQLNWNISTIHSDVQKLRETFQKEQNATSGDFLTKIVKRKEYQIKTAMVKHSKAATDRDKIMWSAHVQSLDRDYADVLMTTGFIPKVPDQVNVEMKSMLLIQNLIKALIVEVPDEDVKRIGAENEVVNDETSEEGLIE